VKKNSTAKTVKILPARCKKYIVEGWLAGWAGWLASCRWVLDSLRENSRFQRTGGRFIDSCENMKSVATDHRAPPSFAAKTAKVVDIRNIMA